nr:adenylate/guanylate cyclase domain-containing protein [Acuticoccus mangrovi]
MTAVAGAPHLLGRRSPLDGIEASLVDLRLLLFGETPHDTAVRVVAIDDATVDAAGLGFPLPRARLAQIVEAIADAGARTLAVDVLLVGRKDAAGDAALAGALQRIPTVIGAAARFPADAVATTVPRPQEVVWPDAQFQESAEVGMVNVVTASTGTPRHVPLVMLSGTGLLSHMALRAAALFAGAEPRLSAESVAIGERVVPLDLGFHEPLRIMGPGGTVPRVSVAELLAGRAGDRLRGRLVLLGYTASGVGDTFVTPYDAVTPGVEILATATAQLVDTPGLVRNVAVRRVDVAATGAIAVAGSLAIALAPLTAGLAIAMGLLAAWLAAVCVMFAEGVWLSLALPTAVAVPVFAVVAAARYLVERRRAARDRQGVTRLGRFQSPALARRLADDPTYLARPVTATVAVLFVDLKGFTGHSERLGLDGTQRLLKDFHANTADVVHAGGGVVLNYMGDGALAVFGMPDTRPDDADRALLAARALIAAVRATAPPDGAVGDLDARVGLHFDDVVMSRLGHDEHQQVTVTGDAVNVASRLMDVAKGAGANIAASAALMAALTRPAQPPAEAMITAPIRGRAATIEVALWSLR